MESLGLRELRQNASALVRRAEAGERLTITVSGRPAAVLAPYAQGTWRSYDEIVHIYSMPTDPTWAEDLGDHVDELRDPWLA